MKRYQVLRIAILKLIVITMVCAALAACVEIPATVVPAPEAKTGVIVMPGERDFPEGVTATSDGTFFAGSMEEGSIMRAQPGATQFEPFIEAGANGLVSVLGVYADEAHNTLWACSADAGNGKLKGSAPVAVKAFDLKTGAAKGSYDLPGGGFPNDLTVDAQGNLYVTDFVDTAHSALGCGRLEAGRVDQRSSAWCGAMGVLTASISMPPAM